MISLDAVEQSILELEQKDTSFATCEKLALLYIVRDNLRGYSVGSSQPLSVGNASDFLTLVDGKSPEIVWPIIDELMDSIHALHPRMYDRVMDKIREG